MSAPFRLGVRPHLQNKIDVGLPPPKTLFKFSIVSHIMSHHHLCVRGLYLDVGRALYIKKNIFIHSR